MGRYIALVLVCIPIAFAVGGIKLIRDAIFFELVAPFPSVLLQFLGGIILLGVGIYIMGGFIFYRDKKRNKVAPRFMKDKKSL